MPQTREHLAILDLLGVARGVVALTKRDLVDDEGAALAREDADRGAGRTRLQAPRSSRCPRAPGSGLDELRAALRGPPATSRAGARRAARGCRSTASSRCAASARS